MVEKFYRIQNHELQNMVHFYEDNLDKRNALVKQFFEKHDIEGADYYFGGNGLCNVVFQEHKKGDIVLCIPPTKKNLDTFAGQLKKNSVCKGLVEFKKTSPILKEFQNECIHQKVVINLLDVEIRHFFKEFMVGGLRVDGLFAKDDYLYLNILTSLYDTITPIKEGFTEIKGSEYYKVLEEMEEE